VQGCGALADRHRFAKYELVKYEPRRTCSSDGALVIDDLPSRAGLIRRSSVTRARIPPSHVDCQIMMFATRSSGTGVLQLTTRAVTPLQREVRHDFPVASFSLPSLLILATTILKTIGAGRELALWVPISWDLIRPRLIATAVTLRM